MHDKDIDSYLSEFRCQEEFWQIEKTLKSERQKNSTWSVHFYISRRSTEKEAVNVGSIYNLEWIDKKENERKGTYCLKSKDQLLKEYTENSDNEIRQGSEIWEKINEIINANY